MELPSIVCASYKEQSRVKLYSKLPVLIVFKPHRSNPPITSNLFYYCFQNLLLYDMFRPNWPSSGNTQLIQDTWEEISDIQFCQKK